MSYYRFFAMILTSTIVMFGLMYLNSYAFPHVYFSETRTYMALYMGAAMAAIMLVFMLGMYSNRTANIAIFGGSALVFALGVFLVRSQVTVQDLSWMRAMIPHHSIAIMTSSRATLTDPRVAGLAEAIVIAQDREISEMRYMIEDIEANGEVGADYPTGTNTAPVEVATLDEALQTPVIAGIRPDPLSTEEIATGLGGAAQCTFLRAVDADPILATSGTDAVVKISDSLILLGSDATIAQGGTVSAEGIAMQVTPDDSGEGAKLVMDLSTEPPLRIGFDGYWRCADGA